MKKTYLFLSIGVIVFVLLGVYGLTRPVSADQGGGEGEQGQQSVMPVIVPSSTSTMGSVMPPQSISSSQSSNENTGEDTTSSQMGDSSTGGETGSGALGIPSSIGTGAGMVITGSYAVRINNAKVSSVQGSTLVVSMFGIPVTVNTSGASFVGGQPIPMMSLQPTSTSTTTVSPSQISVGDEVTIQGRIDPTTGIVQASLVRDLTTQVQANSAIMNRINQLLQLIQQLRTQIPTSAQ